jgi:hypothetical protein
LNILLHIGINKTGSSSIQFACQNNKDVLASAGILYPNIGMEYSAHHGLAFDIQKKGSRESNPSDNRGELSTNWLEELEVEARDYDWVVLSSEAFHSQGNPKKVAEKLSGHNVKVLIYVREHFSYLRSWYQQVVQSNNITCSLREFAGLVDAAQSSVIDQWAEAFGEDQIISRIFDKKFLSDGNIISDFFTSTPLPDIDITQFSKNSTTKNPSVSGNLLFIKKMANLTLTHEESHSIADEIGAMTILNSRYQGPIQVAQETAENIRYMYKEDRKQLLEKYSLNLDAVEWSCDGQASPDLPNLKDDWKTIVAELRRTDKVFLEYLNRLPYLNLQ